jgi:hypothetical protein
LSFVYLLYILCISCVYPVCTRHPFRSTSSVKSYLRYYLTADSRTSPVPAMFHFLSIFITFIYRCSRDLWIALYPFIWCVFYDTLRPVLILHSSCIHPFCIPVCILCVSRHSSGVHPTRIPFYHLRSNLTFGLILPSV